MFLLRASSVFGAYFPCFILSRKKAPLWCAILVQCASWYTIVVPRQKFVGCRDRIGRIPRILKVFTIDSISLTALLMKISGSSEYPVQCYHDHQRILTRHQILVYQNAHCTKNGPPKWCFCGLGCAHHFRAHHEL